MSHLLRRAALIASTAMWVLCTRLNAQQQTSIVIQGQELPNGLGYDAGTVTLTINGYSKTVTYGRFSTTASIASTFGALFSQDCNSPAVAKAEGATLTIVARASQGGVLTSVIGSSTGQLNSFAVGASAPITPAPTPTISALNYNLGPSTMGIAVSGTNLGSTTKNVIITVAGISAKPVKWDKTSHIFAVPSGAPVGLTTVTVTVSGTAGDPVPFTVSAPFGVEAP